MGVPDEQSEFLVPRGAVPAVEHFVLSGEERAAGAPWLLVTAASLLFQSRACVFLRTQSFLSSGQGCFWLINAGAGEETRAPEEDGEWQMLCHRRTLDGASINNWDVPWNLSQGQIYPCTPSSHPFCFLILSCSLC